MVNMIIVMLITLGLSFIFKGIIEFIRKNDDECSNQLKLFSKDKYMVLIFIFFNVLFLYMRYKLSLDLLFYMIVLVVLAAISYTDIKIKYIYTFLSQIVFIISVIYFLIRSHNIVSIKYLLINLGWIAAFILIRKITVCWGKGDTYLLLAVSLIVGAKGSYIYSGVKLPMALVTMFIISCIAVLTSIPMVLFGKRKLSDKFAMGPSIAMGTLLTIIAL